MNYYESDEYIDAKKQLKDEYAICFQKIATYIHGYYINGIEHEENCLLQIMDDFLSAQSEGKPINKITGTDVRKYSDIMMRAELKRKNRNLYFVELIASISFSYMLIIFCKILMFNNFKLKFDYFLNITFGGFELTFVFVSILIVLANKIFSKIFFEHIKISRFFYFVSSFIFFVFLREIATFLNQIIPINIPVSFLLYITLVFIPLPLLIAIGNKERKRKASYNIDSDYIEDIPEQVVCPECGKKHDYDYPKCPYCKHNYNIDNEID